jgi:hypothetical protein
MPSTSSTWSPVKESLSDSGRRLSAPPFELLSSRYSHPRVLAFGGVCKRQVTPCVLFPIGALFSALDCPYTPIVSHIASPRITPVIPHTQFIACRLGVNFCKWITHSYPPRFCFEGDCRCMCACARVFVVFITTVKTSQNAHWHPLPCLFRGPRVVKKAVGLPYGLELWQPGCARAG